MRIKDLDKCSPPFFIRFIFMKNNSYLALIVFNLKQRERQMNRYDECLKLSRLPNSKIYVL